MEENKENVFMWLLAGSLMEERPMTREYCALAKAGGQKPAWVDAQ